MRVGVELEDGGLIGWVMWDGFSDTTAVEGGVTTTGDQTLHLPNEFYLRLPGGGDQPSLSIKYEVRDGRPICSKIELEAKPSGREVIPADLDIIKRGLSEWTRAATTMVMTRVTVNPETGSKRIGLADTNQATAAFRAIDKKPRRRKITERLLVEVADLYREHLDNKPWDAIADHYDVSPATAGRYVMLARRAGHLPPTESGKKKA